MPTIVCRRAEARFERRRDFALCRQLKLLPLPALQSLQAHREANDGAWPETVAVNLWGLDSIKTKGESGVWPIWVAGRVLWKKVVRPGRCSI